MSTYTAKPGEIKANWHVVDASDQVLGRLASKLATILQGKHKASYTPHVDTGDYVIVLNAEKIRVTGKKSETIEYDKYTRYPGGHYWFSFREMNENHPERIIEIAVKRMMPKSKLGRSMLGKLKVYKGDKHDHAAQQPKPLKLA